MEFIEAINLWKRYCKERECANCILFTSDACPSCKDDFFATLDTTDMKIIHEELTAYKKTHPLKTILSDFLEKYPNAVLDENGTPSRFCPSDLGYKDICRKTCTGDRCKSCWGMIIEE